MNLSQFDHAKLEITRYIFDCNEEILDKYAHEEVKKFAARGLNILDYILIEEWNPDKRTIDIYWTKLEETDGEKIRKYLEATKRN
jgi:hypothetical protein